MSKKNKKQEDLFLSRVPLELFNMDLSFNAIKLYILIDSFDNNDNPAFFSQKYAMEKMGCKNRNLISRAIKELEEKNLIKVIRKSKHSNQYIRMPNKSFEKHFGLMDINAIKFLSKTELKVYAYILAFQGVYNITDKQRIAKELQIHISQVYKALKSLNEKGLLHVVSQVKYVKKVIYRAYNIIPERTRTKINKQVHYVVTGKRLPEFLLKFA